MKTEAVNTELATSSMSIVVTMALENAAPSIDVT